MKHFRFSIRNLMVVVVLLGIGFAALRYPTPFWANVWYSFTLGSLTLAVPAAVYRRGEQRAFWVGFAACGWVYFMMALAPWLEREGGFQFVTTTILDIMAPHICAEGLSGAELCEWVQSPVCARATNPVASLESPGISS